MTLASFSFPDFSEPTPLGDGRRWTASFDSFDERKADLYYSIAVDSPGKPPVRFMAKLFPWWAADVNSSWSDPSFADQLKKALHAAAAFGRTNTNYAGRTPAESAKALPIGRLFRCANGHLSFEIEEAAPDKVMEWVGLLASQFQFQSEMPAFGLDEIICEGRVGETKLAVGYDHWSGCYVMAFDDEGDALIGRIAEFLASPPKPVAPAAVEPAAAPQPAPRAKRRPPIAKRIPDDMPIYDDILDLTISRFVGLSSKLAEGTCCVLENEWTGYNPTPLEESLRQCIEAELLPCLDRGAALLTTDRLGQILTGVVKCRPAVAAYRARLLSECGDYGNEFSALATPVARVVESLRRALAGRPERLRLLDDVPGNLIDEKVRLFFLSEGRLDQQSRTLREFLTQ